jgi:hypothetical protein
LKDFDGHHVKLNLIFSLDSIVLEQLNGDTLYKIVSKRKKVPLSAKDVWRYNRMHREDIFSKPLIHMRQRFPRTRSHDKTNEARDGAIDLNLSPPHQMQEQWRCLDGVIDLNLSPPHQMQKQERYLDGVIDLTLLGNGYSVAHHYSPSVAHCWCATTITPLLTFSSGALVVRHCYLA